MTLLIERREDHASIIFILSGRIEVQHMPELESLLDREGRTIVLDLTDVKLVDGEAVLFLSHCETDGIILRNCPAYIRKWIERERGE